LRLQPPLEAIRAERNIKDGAQLENWSSANNLELKRLRKFFSEFHVLPNGARRSPMRRIRREAAQVFTLGMEQIPAYLSRFCNELTLLR